MRPSNARTPITSALLGLAVSFTSWGASPSVAAAKPEPNFGPSLCGVTPGAPIVFRFGTGARPVGVPAVGTDGSVYVGTSEGYVHALAPDGAYRWGYTLRGPVTGRPTMSESGAILVPTASRIYALRPSGTLLWVVESPVSVMGDLVRDALGHYRFATEDGRLFSLAASGALITHVPGRVPFSALPVGLPEGTVAVGRKDGTITAFFRGKSRQYRVPEPPRALVECPGADACAVAGRQVFALGAAGDWHTAGVRASGTSEWLAVLSDERHLELYRGAGHERRFTIELPDSASAAPAIDREGRTFVPLRSGVLFGVSAQGVPFGCTELASSPLGAPVVDAARSRVLVTASEGVLAAVAVN